MLTSTVTSVQQLLVINATTCTMHTHHNSTGIKYFMIRCCVYYILLTCVFVEMEGHRLRCHVPCGCEGIRVFRGCVRLVDDYEEVSTGENN